MKKIFLLLSIIFSSESFSEDKAYKEFAQCKNEVRELRKSFAHNTAYGGEYFFNSEFFHRLTRIPDLIYIKARVFTNRPWIRHFSIEKKLSVCLEVKNQMIPYYGEPIGISSQSRGDSQEEQNAIFENTRALGDRAIFR